MHPTELSRVNLRKHEPTQRVRVDIVTDGSLVLPPAEELNYRLRGARVCPPPRRADQWLRAGGGLSEHRAERARAVHPILMRVGEEHGEQFPDVGRIFGECGQIPDNLL